MYAIVEIAGQQFKVEEGRKIFVHRLDAKEGDRIDFEKVLLIEDNDKVIIGEPVINNAVVEGLVLDHVRGDKVIVFKKKRKKGYRVKNGHRQNFTRLEILNILTDKSAPRKDPVTKEKAVKHEKPAAEAPEVTEVKEPEKKVSARKTAPKKQASKEVKAEEGKKSPSAKAAVKKSSEKKPAEKKAAGKKKDNPEKE